MTECEMCGRLFSSMQAAWNCEDRDLAEARDTRRPVRAVMRPANTWEDD